MCDSYQWSFRKTQWKIGMNSLCNCRNLFLTRTLELFVKPFIAFPLPLEFVCHHSFYIITTIGPLSENKYHVHSTAYVLFWKFIQRLNQLDNTITLKTIVKNGVQYCVLFGSCQRHVIIHFDVCMAPSYEISHEICSCKDLYAEGFSQNGRHSAIEIYNIHQDPTSIWIEILSINTTVVDVQYLHRGPTLRCCALYRLSKLL